MSRAGGWTLAWGLVLIAFTAIFFSERLIRSSA